MAYIHGQHIVNRALPLGNAPCGPSTIGAEGDDPTPGIAAEANGVAETLGHANVLRSQGAGPHYSHLINCLLYT